MKWKSSAPTEGQRRHKRVFLCWPTKIDGNWYWLITITLKQRYSHCGGAWDVPSGYFWVTEETILSE